ncbi:hypothetical protein ASPVEDRAFT_755166 [Aspergillus versicolor CBS 583.65]|uniref:Uncharacterized protein n=1 Tax=Aspergillus versicolor CBS 583.65 TaxID=1036611 RepID=A0A1L9PQI0_ASPVE|nr:uncharacterized protein ASPVEDRAFT_755166 [Aspergillus versicolor CBS 583.65]OJJ03770.1 hypothetical protein ASPVEDRAFT_755166 [Aspergillus versicolor CBS 583.65]
MCYLLMISKRGNTPMVSQHRILTPKNSVGEPSLLLGGSVVVPCIRGFCAMKIRQTHRHDAVVSLLGEVGRLDSLECRGGQEQCARYTTAVSRVYTALDTGLMHSPKAVSVSLNRPTPLPPVIAGSGCPLWFRIPTPADPQIATTSGLTVIRSMTAIGLDAFSRHTPTLPGRIWYRRRILQGDTIPQA